MSDTLRGAWRETLSLTWHTLKFRASFVEDLRYRTFKYLAWAVIVTCVMIDAYATGKALAPVVIMLVCVSLVRGVRRITRRKGLTHPRPKRTLVLVQINRVEREKAR